MINKIILLNTKPNNHFISYVLFFLLIITTLFLSIFTETYDTYNTTGIVKCIENCSISITVPYDKADIFSNKSYIKYQDKKYAINEIEYEDPYLSNNIPVEDITLQTDITTQNKIINFQILYNKQRIIKKIKNIILEGNWNE